MANGEVEEVNGDRQRGQEGSLLEDSHWDRHPLWKKWLQLFATEIFWRQTNVSRHIEHCCIDKYSWHFPNKKRRTDSLVSESTSFVARLKTEPV